MTLKLLHYVWRSIVRHKRRSGLTIIGIATALFLFCFIEGLQSGVREATEGAATKNVLVVYQKSRFCPSTCQIPERYAAQIARLDGVSSVLPVKIFVNNCRTSLDTVVFRGVPPERVGERGIKLVQGDLAKFSDRSDSALVGTSLAQRRNLKVGDRFQIGNVGVSVAGIFTSDAAGEDAIAYTHLAYLQRSRGVQSVGRVTQMDVTIKDASKAEEIARAVDEMFASEEVQTSTKSHKAFVTSSTGDLLSLVRFTRWLGILCVLVVLALTANTVYVMVKDRVKEHAILHTLGFRGRHLFFIVLAESLVLSLSGGLLGVSAAALALKFGHLGLGAEGTLIAFTLTPIVITLGLGAAAVTGVLAGIVPAIEAAVTPIVESLRKV